ncbi:MAG: DMT family transporter [Albidovulum sp.]|nr:DMT family transporter [Albidovulum sp.]
MVRKDRIDASGAAVLVGISLMLGFNQVVIKVTNGGLQPVFWAGLRSFGAIFCVLLWMHLTGKKIHIAKGTVSAAVLMGLVFSTEFLLLFVALDHTTVVRVSVIFYSMPVWLALLAHFLLPGQRLTWGTSAGFALAMAGVTWAIIDRKGADAGSASLVGDLCALGAAIGWAGIPLCARGTAMKRVPAEMQLLWQVVVSTPILLAASILFGPWIRELGPIHYLGVLFQIVFVTTATFIVWFRMLSIYPPSGVASFSFLAPLAGVFFGWIMLNEPLSVSILGALALVCAGLVLINRPSSGSASDEA